MAFGKRKSNDNIDEDVTESAAAPVEEELDGPFDIDDFDDPAVAAHGRLDLGSVLIPMPEAGQVQVELNEGGVPSAVWVVTPHGRFTIAAYAAPKSAGLWREVATELADSLRKDSANVSILDGPWGREVVGAAPGGQERSDRGTSTGGQERSDRGTSTGGQERSDRGTTTGVVRFIGVDGYRWMIRCVVNGVADSIDALTGEARDALADTVVRRGDTPLPVRTPLAVQLPEPMAAQLRAAAAAQAAGTQNPQPAQQQPPQPVARRSAQGSAMQQLRTITGG